MERALDRIRLSFPAGAASSVYERTEQQSGKGVGQGQHREEISGQRKGKQGSSVFTSKSRHSDAVAELDEEPQGHAIRKNAHCGL